MYELYCHPVEYDIIYIYWLNTVNIIMLTNYKRPLKPVLPDYDQALLGFSVPPCFICSHLWPLPLPRAGRKLYFLVPLGTSTLVSIPWVILSVLKFLGLQNYVHVVATCHIFVSLFLGLYFVREPRMVLTTDHHPQSIHTMPIQCPHQC